MCHVQYGLKRKNAVFTCFKILMQLNKTWKSNVSGTFCSIYSSEFFVNASAV